MALWRRWGLAFISPCFLTVGNLFHVPPLVFLEVVVTSSFNFVIITQEILVPGVMGLWRAWGFVLMSLALWFTPVFSLLWVVPHRGTVSLSRVSGVLLEDAWLCLLLAKRRGRGEVMVWAAPGGPPHSGLAGGSAEGYLMPAGHLILWDWSRANVSKDHMSMPGPYVSWGAFLSPSRNHLQS